MNIDDLKVSELKAIAALAAGLGQGPAAHTNCPCANMIGKYVIVRAYSGVFHGILREKQGDTVLLEQVRQIYSWGSKDMAEKVQTCGDIAVRGLGSDSRVSSPVERGSLEKVGSIFECTATATSVIASRKWA